MYDLNYLPCLLLCILESLVCLWQFDANTKASLEFFAKNKNIITVRGVLFIQRWKSSRTPLLSILHANNLNLPVKFLKCSCHYWCDFNFFLALIPCIELPASYITKRLSVFFTPAVKTTVIYSRSLVVSLSASSRHLN